MRRYIYLLTLASIFAMPVNGAFAETKEKILTAMPAVKAVTPIPEAKVLPPAPDIVGLTLYGVLTETYKNNPEINAMRAELKSVDENYSQAMAGFKPVLTGSADYSSSHSSASRKHSDPKSISLDVSQSLYSGGSTMAEVRQSESKIKAARAKLNLTEQKVLFDAVTAYMNIIRDEKIVELTLNNEKVLTTHLKAVSDRLKVGDVTKTDVSQSEARLAKAMAGRIAAEGNLKKSRAFFEKVVALNPDRLQKPDINITLPTTLEEALTLAQNNNPAIAVSQFTQQAAKSQTRMIEGELLPTIDLTGSVAKTFNPSLSAAEVDNSRAIGVQAALPLYTGGATLSRIRQSQQNENQQRIDGVNTDRLVHQAVIDAWEGLTSAAAETKARQAQIDASKLALDGVTVERDYGSRSTLDLLDAEQEYLDAQVAFTGAETDKTIATFDLLKSVGNLTVTGLHLETPVYNLDNLFQGGLFQNSKKSWLHKQIHKGK